MSRSTAEGKARCWRGGENENNIAPVRSSLHYSILSSYIQVNNSYKEVLLYVDLTRIMYLIRNKRKRNGGKAGKGRDNTSMDTHHVQEEMDSIYSFRFLGQKQIYPVN